MYTLYTQHRTKPTWQQARPSFKLLSQPPPDKGSTDLPSTAGNVPRPLNPPGGTNQPGTSESLPLYHI